jgi:hypothetical protein
MILTGETKILGEEPVSMPLFHHKSDMVWLAMNPRIRSHRLATKSTGSLIKD